MYWGLIGFFFILKDVTSLFCCSMSRLPVQLVLMMREIGSLWTRVVRWKGQKMEWLFFKESRKRQAVCYFPVEFNSSPKGEICFENYIIFITAIKKSKIKFCYLLQKSQGFSLIVCRYPFTLLGRERCIKCLLKNPTQLLGQDFYATLPNHSLMCLPHGQHVRTLNILSSSGRVFSYSFLSIFLFSRNFHQRNQGTKSLYGGNLSFLMTHVL